MITFKIVKIGNIAFCAASTGAFFNFKTERDEPVFMYNGEPYLFFKDADDTPVVVAVRPIMVRLFGADPDSAE